MRGWLFVVVGVLGLALGIFVDGLVVARRSRAMFIGLAGESITGESVRASRRYADSACYRAFG